MHNSHNTTDSSALQELVQRLSDFTRKPTFRMDAATMQYVKDMIAYLDDNGFAWLKGKIQRGEVFAVIEGERQILRAFHCAASSGEVRILLEKGTK